MLKIIMKRIEGKAMNVIIKTQFGFRRGMGTREAIRTMKMLCERSLEYETSVLWILRKLLIELIG